MDRPCMRHKAQPGEGLSLRSRCAHWQGLAREIVSMRYTAAGVCEHSVLAAQICCVAGSALHLLLCFVCPGISVC